MIKNAFKRIFDPIAAFVLGSIIIISFYIKRHFLGYILPNFHEVEGSSIIRGGQPSKRGMIRLMEKGVKVIINLRASDRDKKMIVKLFGKKIKSVHVPIYPFQPNDFSVVKFLKIFAKHKGEQVYVHCFHGADRTGLMCAMYRIVFDGWEKDKAIAEMKRKGFHFWHRSIITYIKNSDIDGIKKKVFAN